MPLVSPVTVPVRVDPLVVVVSGCQVVPSVEYSYPVTAEPPSEGAVKVTVALALPGVALSPVGAAGAVAAGVTLAAAEGAGPGGTGARAGGQGRPVVTAVGGHLVAGDRRSAVRPGGEAQRGAGIARCRAQPGGSGRCRGRGDTGGGRGCPGTDAVDRPDLDGIGNAVGQPGDGAGPGGTGARAGGQGRPVVTAVGGHLVAGDRRSAVRPGGEAQRGAGIARCRAQPGGSGRCRGRGDTGGGRG